MGNLLLVLSHADTAVKTSLCRQETLLALFGAMRGFSPDLQLTALKALKHLTTDPSMLEPLQACSCFLNKPHILPNAGIACQVRD